MECLTLPQQFSCRRLEAAVDWLLDTPGEEQRPPGKSAGGDFEEVAGGRMWGGREEVQVCAAFEATSRSGTRLAGKASFSTDSADSNWSKNQKKQN